MPYTLSDLARLIAKHNFCVLASQGLRGPHVAGVGYFARRLDLYIPTSANTTKARNVGQDPRVAVHIHLHVLSLVRCELCFRGLTKLSFEAPTLGIGKLMKEGTRFFVPHHQRDFSWTDDEIEQFLTDIQDARTAKHPDYFIGLMVFMRRDKGELRILDGQQRLVTAQIVLACVRNWLRNHGHIQDGQMQPQPL
jgi:hypothetical protein